MKLIIDSIPVDFALGKRRDGWVDLHVIDNNNATRVYSVPSWFYDERESLTGSIRTSGHVFQWQPLDKRPIPLYNNRRPERRRPAMHPDMSPDNSVPVDSNGLLRAVLLKHYPATPPSFDDPGDDEDFDYDIRIAATNQKLDNSLFSEATHEDIFQAFKDLHEELLAEAEIQRHEDNLDSCNENYYP